MSISDFINSLVDKISDKDKVKTLHLRNYEGVRFTVPKDFYNCKKPIKAQEISTIIETILMNNDYINRLK